MRRWALARARGERCRGARDRRWQPQAVSPGPRDVRCPTGAPTAAARGASARGGRAPARRHTQPGRAALAADDSARETDRTRARHRCRLAIRWRAGRPGGRAD